MNELHYFDQINSKPEKDISRKLLIKYFARLYATQEKNHWIEVSEKDIEKAEIFLDSLNKNVINGFQLYFKFTELTAKNANAEITVDQTGKYIFYINSISKGYPDSKFIYIYRDPRAVLYSQKFRWKIRMRGSPNVPEIDSIRTFINYHPFTMSWLMYKINMIAEKIKSKENVYFICYEDLIVQPEREIKNICRFLNVNFEENMLDVSLITSSHNSDNSGQGFIKENINRWKKRLSKTEIWINQIINARFINNQDYYKINVFPNLVLLLMWIILYPIHVLGVILINYKNILRVFGK
jgi:omega-hydroxy-beta-dihydromenaquinone-9 sulfotransferase